MDRYWVRIGAGAAAVFGVGIVGISLAKKGVAELKSAALGPVREVLQDVPRTLLNFRLEGRRIGQVRSLDVSNEGEWTPKSIAMTVELDRQADMGLLGDCSLTTERFHHGRRNEVNFRCASAEEIDEDELVQIGEVHFQPADVVRPLLVAEHDVERMERSDLRSLKGSFRSNDGRNVTGEATYDFETHHGKRERGSVRLNAGDGRALIEIRDDAGRELFSLRANDHGVSIDARNKRGHELLKLLAGETGVSLDVHGDRRHRD